MLRGIEAQRFEDGRHHVDRLDEALLHTAARRIRRAGGVGNDHRHALDAIVEQLLLAQAAVADLAA